MIFHKRRRMGQLFKRIKFSDIRTWILFFFLLRLVGITNPPLEVGHNWRQSLTNMIARNFHESGPDLFHPMIDMAGENSGIIASEFPFFNYLIFLWFSIFDFSHWAGRLINLSVSSLGLLYFYRLLKNIINKDVAFYSTIILTTSIWFSFSRKIMPDTFSVSLVIIALYFAYSFLAKGRKYHLLLFFLSSALGMLSKIPALSLFCSLSIVFIIKEVDLNRKIKLFSAAAASFAMVCMWYFYWVPHLLSTYRYQLYFPKGIMEGIQEIKPLIPELLEKFYFSSLRSYLALLFFIGGIFFLFRDKKKKLLITIGVISIVFTAFIIKTGSVFPKHNYYIIPYTPIMAMIAGYGLATIPKKLRYFLLGVIMIEGIANQNHDFFIKEKRFYKLELENISEKYIAPDELIVINGGPSPQDIYFSHRKGWTVHQEEMMNSKHMDSLISLGAKYLIVDRSRSLEAPDQYQDIYQDEHYTLLKLSK